MNCQLQSGPSMKIVNRIELKNENFYNLNTSYSRLSLSEERGNAAAVSLRGLQKMFEKSGQTFWSLRYRDISFEGLKFGENPEQTLNR